MRRAPHWAVVAAALALGGPACTTTEPTAFLVRYELRAYSCGSAGCAAGDTAGVASAALGDTVWLLHRVALVASVDDSTLVTLRPACAVNIDVLRGGTAQRTVPATPSCPDSTYRVYLSLVAGDERYTPWVVDSGLAVGQYVLRGRVVVQPSVHPQVGFELH